RLIHHFTIFNIKADSYHLMEKKKAGNKPDKISDNREFDSVEGNSKPLLTIGAELPYDIFFSKERNERFPSIYTQ
ncbi:MAG: hypothetical protein ACQEWU_12775, partial [Bacillota bacterium]|nr:hypothetical protein [Virgibacillus sp. AGTR]